MLVSITPFEFFFFLNKGLVVLLGSLSGFVVVGIDYIEYMV